MAARSRGSQHRPCDQTPEKEGTVLREALHDCKKIIRDSRGCDFKVGIAIVASQRWGYYRANDSHWMPSHLFVLTAVDNRSGACFPEAGIILGLELWEV